MTATVWMVQVTPELTGLSRGGRQAQHVLLVVLRLSRSDAAFDVELNALVCTRVITTTRTVIAPPKKKIELDCWIG